MIASRRIVPICLMFLMGAKSALAQIEFADVEDPPEDITQRTIALPDHRQMVISDIPGATKLGQPTWLSGHKQDIRTEKHGLAHPAFFDWNGDGKNDLLLGEFETGETGSYIKVYLNEGSKESPEFSGEFIYATDVEGNKITNYQWCCIGIHPRIVDLDQDGFLDILSGQYNPGQVSWWRGSEKGFLPRVFVEQEGYEEGARLSLAIEPWNPESNSYWNYTSADFGDFNGDGLLDLFVGGSDGPRVALNTGTRDKPKFGLRKYLLHVDGHPLKVAPVNSDHVKQMRARGHYPCMAGVGKSYVTPIDWDYDGVLDLLVTHEYGDRKYNPVEFFRGIRTDDGIRFESRQPLFQEVNGQKALPGCQPMLTVADYNSDGIRDLLFGLSVPTLDGFNFSDDVAWLDYHEYQLQMPGKDPGRSLKYYGGFDGAVAKMESQPMMKRMMIGKLDDNKYLTLRHRGHAFVMLGESRGEPAVVTLAEAEPEIRQPIIKNEQTKFANTEGPMSISMTMPERVGINRTHELKVTLDIEDGWFAYVDNEANRKSGNTPVTIRFELPDGVALVGELERPDEEKMYIGTGITFTQKFRYQYQRGGEFLRAVDVNAIVEYQVCDAEKCLPPDKQSIQGKATISMH